VKILLENQFGKNELLVLRRVKLVGTFYTFSKFQAGWRKFCHNKGTIIIIEGSQNHLAPSHLAFWKIVDKLIRNNKY
jgi:hypothetical protein